MIKFILNNNNFHWIQILKIGIIFILIGMLILFFKDIIIVLLASLFILIGILIIFFSLKLWNEKDKRF